MRIDKYEFISLVRKMPYMFMTPTALEFYNFRGDKLVSTKLDYFGSRENSRGCMLFTAEIITAIRDLDEYHIVISDEYDRDINSFVLKIGKLKIQLAVTAHI